MRITMVASYYPPHIGGLEIVAQKHAQSLAKNGISVSVVTAQTEGHKTTVNNEDGVRVYRVKTNNFFDRKFQIPFPAGGIEYLRILNREINSADLVHIHDVFYMSSWQAYILALIYKKPVVLTQHVAEVEHQSRLVSLVQKAVYATFGRMIFNGSRAIIVYNKTVRDFLKSFGINMSKVYETKNGIDLTFFNPGRRSDKTKLRQELQLPVTKPLILFVGRLVTKKGFDKLFAARSPKDYEIVIAGNGTIPPDWKKASGVYFTGPVSHKQLIKLYRAADMFVFPAVGEIFTIVMQEAMACGLPVITTDDPGYRPYRINRKLLTLTQRSPEDIRSAIRKVISNRRLYRQMSRYSVNTARKWFDWEKNFSDVLEVYGEVV